MKPERRMNYSRKNQFVWNDMLAALDLKLICAGVAFRISDWPGLNDFSGDFFFRLHLPLGIKAQTNWMRPCVDGTYGEVMKLYREWKISGDTAWLKSLWPLVKPAIAYAWRIRTAGIPDAPA